MRYRIFNYLRSSCDLGCNTVWLKCDCVSKKTITASFIGNFMEVTSFMHMQCLLCMQDVIHDIIKAT